MSSCYQFKDQTILQHGQAVRQEYNEIVTALERQDYSQYEFPQLLRDNWNNLKHLLYDMRTMHIYQVYHDCGKPYCAIVGEDGKQRFPNHVEKSSEVFSKCFSKTQNYDIIKKLIESDMVFHSGSMEEITEFKKNNTRKFLFSLWLTNFAELYANKRMFDENNQTSFKIKHKKLCKVLNKILL